MLTRSLTGCFVALIAGSCGGTRPPAPEGPPPGTTHAEEAQILAKEPADAAPLPSSSAEPATASEIDAGPPAAPPSAPFTFELVNDGDTDLVFGLDKGWQPVIFGYTGKPPKAKPAIFFPTFCTESCDASLQAMCPVCREPTDDRARKRQEQAETRRETAPAGGALSVEWDGKLLAYEPAPREARAKKRTCTCWRKVEPPADTYTIKACGLRPAREAGAGSRPTCAETQVALPAASPAKIELRFGP